ncbi:MAG: hypothetical protein R3178_09110, partial [Rhodothermales bacterium]|nr:hypothetical protein [Rhodothermales bacterium]
MQHRVYLLLALVLVPQFARGQTGGILQIDDPVTTTISRLSLKGLLPGSFVVHHPLSVHEAREYLRPLMEETEGMTDHDIRLAERVFGLKDSAAWGLLPRWIPQVYRNGTDLVSIEGEGYRLQINPLANLSIGVAAQSSRPDRDRWKTTWQNTRGIRFSGSIGNHIFFESRLEENQLALPEAAKPWMIQRLGRVNGTRSRDDELIDANTLDYFVATGIVGVRFPHVEIRLGRDRNMWGFGNTSLLLSDFAHVYDQIQIRTTVWRLQYVSLYSVLSDRSAEAFEDEVPPKFAVFHRLALNLADNVQIGLFESVVFTPDEPSNAGSYLGFLNPVVFYRAVDGDIGSPGNVLIGADAMWRIRPGIAVHGQVAFDEFNLGKLTTEPGWWKNTYATLVGVQLADVGL